MLLNVFPFPIGRLTYTIQGFPVNIVPENPAIRNLKEPFESSVVIYVTNILKIDLYSEQYAFLKLSKINDAL